jgi:PAS domain S-box-containing protein
VEWFTRLTPLGRVPHANDLLSMLKNEGERPSARDTHEEERALETSAQLGMAIRLGRLGAWTLDVRTLTLEWSSEARAIHNLPVHFPLSVDAVAALIDPTSRPAVEHAVRSCIEHGLAFDMEVRAFTWRHKPIWVRLIGEAACDVAGKVHRIQGAVQDITDIKQVTIRANELAQRLTATLESMTDAFVTLDRDWRFTYVNGEAERLLQRPREQLLGKVVWDEFPESVGTRFHQEYERALAEFITVEFETFSTVLNAWCKVSAHPSVEGLAVYFQDVTASKMVREALEDSEEQYRMLFENSMDAILRTRPEDGTVVRANAAACAMFGMTQEQICGSGRAGLVAPDDPRLPVLLELRQRNGRAAGQLTLLRGDGSRFQAELSSALYYTSDGEARTHMVIRDVTERLKARQKILSLNSELAERVHQRTAQLEQANAELREFAHSLAHDLRSPIAAINGFMDMLEQSLPSTLPERSRHYLERIRSAARRMDAHTEGLLSLASVSQLPMSTEVVDLSALANEILAQLQEREPERAVQAQVQSGLSASGDPRLLRMALENLLGNAWKFTARRELARIEVTGYLNRHAEMVYCIRDNGAGFDMAYAGKLFGSFQRLHSQSEFAGTGIGLANVQRIISRHGGRVWAEAVEGVGATFQFTLGGL